MTLSRASTSAGTVNLATADGTSKSPDDYKPALKTASFAPGEISKRQYIAIVNDAVTEGSEYFFVSVRRATNAVLGNATARVIISDDEP